MKLPILPNYRDGNKPFPDRDIDPKKKDAAYCAQWAQAIYSLFTQNKTAWATWMYDEFSELRAYSCGEQSVEKYKTWLTSSDSSDATNDITFDDTALSRVSKREGWYNILFENISPLPKIMNAIHGMFDKIDYNPYVNTVDSKSQQLTEDIMYRKLFEARNREWQNEYKKNAGIPIDEDTFFPKSIEEFNMYKAKGGYKLNVAIAMQKLLRYTFDISYWDSIIRKKIVDDLTTIGYGATMDYFDSEDNKWKCKWIDPARLVMQFSNEYDYSDSEYAGYFTLWTISNLKKKLPEVPEGTWKSLAKNWIGQYGNPSSNWETRYSLLDTSTSIYRYDGFKVPVFEATWIDTDTTRRLYYNSKYGRKSIINLGYNSEIKELSEEQKAKGVSQSVKSIFKRQPYQCAWVVGTDYCFDFGPIKMAARNGYSKPRLPYHVEQLLQPSIVKRLKPIADQMVMVWLKHQNSIAMMVEKGYALNYTQLANVMMGGKKMDTADIIRFWRQTGILLFSYSAGVGNYQGGAATPVLPIDGGMGERVRETAESLDILFKLIEGLIGINPVTLGAPPDPNAPVSTTEASMQATANVLKPIMDACKEVKDSVGDSLMRRIQVGIRRSDVIRGAYQGVISVADMEALQMMENDGVQYGLTLKAKPDGATKAHFREYMTLALQNVREQRPGIEVPDAIDFEIRIEMGDDIFELYQDLQYVITKNKEEARQAQLENIEAQGQQNMQLEQQKQQNLLAQQEAEGKVKMAEEALRGQIKSDIAQEEGNLKLLEQAYKDMMLEQGLPITATT